LESFAYDGEEVANGVEGPHSDNDVFELLLFPYNLSSLGVERLIKDTNNVVEMQGLHDSECLLQNFVCSGHFGRRGIDSGQVAHGVLDHCDVSQKILIMNP